MQDYLLKKGMKDRIYDLATKVYDWQIPILSWLANKVRDWSYNDNSYLE